MGFIADLSRYDPLEAVDLYDGVILNVEDPGYAQKRDRAIARGVPWGVYSWVYPGGGRNAMDRAMVGKGSPLGMWLDYEQQGVAPGDLTAAYQRARELGVQVGTYTYLYVLPTVAAVIGDGPLWLAYYPGANDGSYQARYSDDARARCALLHQFSSSNGTRDLNVVLDEARWAIWTGQSPTPTPEAEDDDMAQNIFIGRKSDELRPADQKAGIFVADGLFPTWKRHVKPEEWQLAKDIATFTNSPPPTVHKLTDEHWDSIPTATA